MTDRGPRVEPAASAEIDQLDLIVTITPSGPLGQACDQYWTVLQDEARLSPTGAQTEPPHCRLTGFFRRSPDRLPEVIADIETAISGAAPRSRRPVAVMGLVDHGTWLGLQLDSPWLDRFITVLCLVHDSGEAEDDVHPEEWLRLLLVHGLTCADGDGPSIDRYVDLAEELIDPGLDVEWTLGLWERTPDGSWHDHARWSITNAPMTG